MKSEVDTAQRYWNNFVDQVVSGLPKFIGALAVLIIGYLIAKLIASSVRKLLGRIQLDKRLHAGSGGNAIQRAIPSPTRLISSLTFWVLMLLVITLAVSILGVPLLDHFVRAIYSYIPNVIAAILIFMVASAISAGIAAVVLNIMGDTPTGKAVASAGPILVMGIAVFMILNQLKIAPQIVTITYAALVGSIALGAALAFGIGGRDTASKIIQDMYEKGQQKKGAVASDVKKGVQEGKSKTGEAKKRMQ